jgi:hypothetical protein
MSSSRIRVFQRGTCLPTGYMISGARELRPNLQPKLPQIAIVGEILLSTYSGSCHLSLVFFWICHSTTYPHIAPVLSPINMSTSPIKTFTEQGADHLERAHTTGSISMSPELFEQLYLAPHSRVKGDLRQKLGNPTPLGKKLSPLSLESY